MVPDRIGRFEILEKIGEGGMGTVFKAQDPKIKRIVAIKVLREGFDTKEQRDRFLLEARLAGGLQNPHIVTIFEIELADLGTPFIVMEYVPGDPLSRLIERDIPMTLARKLELMEALCSGLADAHAAGVVHRDIKPANLILRPDGVLKIVDFGIARDSESTVTRVGQIIGTPNYMAPEQLNGQEIDNRTDIFAVGAVFYELLTYRRAFPGSHTQAITAVLARDPEPLSRVCPGLDPQIESVVLRALAKEPRSRYQSIADMRREIVRHRERLEWEPETLAIPRSPRAAAVPADAPASGSTPREKRSREETMRRALSEVDAARRQFESGETREAVARLERFAPQNDLVDDALTDLRERAAEADRQAQRRAAVERAMRMAADAFERGEFDAAIRAADEALGSDERYPPARDVKRRAQAALDEQQRLEEADRRVRAAVDEARQTFAAGDQQAAIERLMIFRPQHPAIVMALSDLRAEAEARAHQEQASASERGRQARQAEQERHDAAARALVDASEQRFRSGEMSGAIEMLGGFSPPHPLVTATLARLTTEFATIEGRRQKEVAEKLALQERAQLEREEASRRAEEARAQRAQQEAAQRDQEFAARQAQLAADRREREAAVQKPEDEAQTIAVPSVRRPTAGGRTLIAGGAALVVMLLAGGLFFYRSRPEYVTLGTDSESLTTVATTSTPEVVATTSTPPASPSPTQPPPIDVAQIVRSVDALRRSATTSPDFAIPLGTAAKLLADGLKQVPGDADLVRTSQGVMADAQRQANASRRAADQAGAANRSTYDEALNHFNAAETRRRAGQIDIAVNEYGVAARLFGDAIKEPSVAQVAGLTTIPSPQAPAIEPAVQAPVPATTVPTTSVVTTSITTTSVAPTIDLSTVQRVLRSYSEAYRTLDVAAVQRVYPGLPDLGRLRITAQRRDYSYCEYTFSNVQIVQSTGVEAIVRADSVESCKPKTAQPARPLPGSQQFTFRKSGSGDWVLAEILVQQ